MFKANFLAALVAATASATATNEDCDYFYNLGCTSGDVTNNPADWASRTFQTPLPGSDDWEPRHQGYGRIQCFNKIVYNSDRSAADVEAVCRQHDSIEKVEYNWAGAGFVENSTFSLDSSFEDALSLTVKATDGSGSEFEITLQSPNFIWQNPAIETPDVYEGGQKGGIVELFGWPHADVEAECEYLGQMGWMGVKIYPAQEAVITDEWPQNGELNPWWFLYQPVSYNLDSRMGDRDALRSLINTCRSHGVRVYADAVINHFSGGGNDNLEHRNGSSDWCTNWSGKDSTGDSPYYTHSWTYNYMDNTGDIPAEEFPAAAMQEQDFHCERSLSSWNDPFQLNYGWLSGLTDVDTESDYVRERIAAYMTDLLSIGFSGFRVDAAKHIQPASLAAIFGKLKRNLGGGDLPADFITYLEVLLGGEAGLLECDYNDYQYTTNFDDKMAAEGLNDSDISKVKIWSSDYPKEMPICGYWIIPASRFAIQNDCHDDQNPGSSSRDMQDKGSVLVREKDVDKHRGFETLLYNRTDADWKIRILLSSYSFMDNGAMGFPDGKSDCANCKGDQCDSCSMSMPFS